MRHGRANRLREARVPRHHLDPPSTVSNQLMSIVLLFVSAIKRNKHIYAYKIHAPIPKQVTIAAIGNSSVCRLQRVGQKNCSSLKGKTQRSAVGAPLTLTHSPHPLPLAEHLYLRASISAFSLPVIRPRRAPSLGV